MCIVHEKVVAFSAVTEFCNWSLFVVGCFVVSWVCKSVADEEKEIIDGCDVQHGF